MTDAQTFALMIQPNRLQGFIWKMILKSQNIAVIWESPNTDLQDNLTQIKQAGLTLPDLLILDNQCLGENPYEFCRWCRDYYPELKVILTSTSQREISAPERDWTIQQGAADLLPGFQRNNLVSSATASLKRVIDVLGTTEINDGALISVLLKLRRELEARQEKRDRQSIETYASELELEPELGYDSASIVQTKLGQPTVGPISGSKPLAAPHSASSSTTNNSSPSPKLRRRYRGISY